MTNFEKVKDFNKVFQIEIPDTVQTDIFTAKPDLVRLKMDLITEEFHELEVAVRNHDLKETVDALADLEYVIKGFALSLGVDLDKAFALVHESNMSKICKTEQEAKDTVIHYLEKINRGDKTYDSPCYRQDKDTGLYIVFNLSTGKVLKSIHYQPVDLTPLLK